MTDKSIEREIEFTDLWYFHNKKAQNYADAIEWADKTMIDKACKWLLDNSNNYFEASGCCSWINYGRLVDDFKKAMEE